jgi:two-component system sensor histidine kinase KdpD
MRQRVLPLLSMSIGVITYVCLGFISVNATTVGFAYLLYVLSIASTWGFFEAAVSSVAATLLLNYFFLPPTGTLTIADPQNWVALFSFLATSLIASQLSTKARRRELDAVERRRDVERLYSFAGRVLIDGTDPFPKNWQKTGEAFGGCCCLFDADRVKSFAPALILRPSTVAARGSHPGTVFADPDRKRVITGVRLGTEPIGSLALQGSRMTDSVLQSIANLVAIGLERAKAQELGHEIEAARRSERLRTTLIDALAHELKTPLTSIRAATTALLTNADQTPPSSVRMLKIADEEAAHLEELIDNTLEMAHLDSDHIDLDMEVSDLGTLVHEVVESMKTVIGDRTLEIVCDKGLPQVGVDRRLIKLAIKQILDNALKYSPSGTPISFRAHQLNGTVAIEVTDHGKGIPAQEQSRIFERFYRSPSVEERIPGSGIG